MDLLIILNKWAETVFIYRIYPAIRRGFCPSRMTSNNFISPMKFCYNTNFTLDLDLWDCFGRKKTPSYNQRNTVCSYCIVFMSAAVMTCSITSVSLAQRGWTLPARPAHNLFVSKFWDFSNTEEVKYRKVHSSHNWYRYKTFCCCFLTTSQVCFLLQFKQCNYCNIIFHLFL